MSSEQFLPSSPILSSVNHHHEDDDIDDLKQSLPQKKSLQQQQHSTPTKKKLSDYPTPNPSSDFPSSSIGLQSPIKETSSNDVETSPLKPELVDSSSTPSPRQLSSDSQYKFVSPMDNVKIVKLQNGREYKFGRSSKMCDFQMSKMNISKLHFTVKQTNDIIEIKCYGLNGMNLTTPKPSIVKFLGKPDQYLIEPTSVERISELNKKGLSSISRCNQKYDNLTNILLMCGEIIKIPKMKGILLDVWDEFVLLDFDDENDDHHHQKNSTQDPIVIVSKDNKDNDNNKQVGLCYKPSDPLELNVVVKQQEELFKKPEKRGRPKSQTPPAALQNHHDNHNHPHTKRSKSTVNTTEEANELYKDISDEEVSIRLSQIDELTSIENVLINHLAFSRLSSTPISVLQKISNKTSQLSKADLQLILIKKIQCCGVIYRVGKDAAGKPLEEEYYYQADLDDDEQRQKLVNDLKGAGSSLRSCRKVHKQYFWKKPKSKSAK